MPRAVQYDTHGGVEVLRVRDLPRPVVGAGQVVVEVRAAGINPGEAAIREGVFAQRWPSTFRPDRAVISPASWSSSDRG